MYAAQLVRGKAIVNHRTKRIDVRLKGLKNGNGAIIRATQGAGEEKQPRKLESEGGLLAGYSRTDQGLQPKSRENAREND